MPHAGRFHGHHYTEKPLHHACRRRDISEGARRTGSAAQTEMQVSTTVGAAAEQADLPMVDRRFHVVLIKPSHYHDDGYVIRWWRGLVPSNSLAALSGLALDTAPRRAPGDDGEIDKA